MTVTEAFFTKAETVSGFVDVPGKGATRYYAQNDGLWGSLTYESPGVDSHRPFRDSGCCPTAVAMAVAALIPGEELPGIAAYARKPFSLCPCSLNDAHCSSHHARYILTSERDYARFLPLVIGDIATGNNLWRYQGRSAIVGTATGFIRAVTDSYGLDYIFVDSFEEAYAAILSGDKAVVGLAGAGGCFTDTGHYIYLASVDADFLYILDPLCRSVYHTNKGSKINILKPGLVSMAINDLKYAYFSNFIIFSRKM